MRMRFVLILALLSAPIAQLPGVGQVQESSLEARKVVQRVTPSYPSVAKKMNLAGTVKLIAVVAPDGKVTAIEPLGGSPLLIQAAKDAVAKWKYAPGSSESREPLEFHFTPRSDQ